MSADFVSAPPQALLKRRVALCRFVDPETYVALPFANCNLATSSKLPFMEFDFGGLENGDTEPMSALPGPTSVSLLAETTASASYA